MNVLVLGGDGYLGWPTSLHFSQHGHTVCAIDNYFRRDSAEELEATALIPTPRLEERVKLWQETTGREIRAEIGDITDYDFLSRVVSEFQPDTIIHYAEQPSAPYSMMDRKKGAFTLQNNLLGTYNIVHAIREHVPQCHLVKLGTMGEYGTPNIDIEEGWIDIEHKGRKDRFLFPRQAGSLYHTTKIQDTDLLWFYVRTWGLRVTDLMQGPVYGLHTEETQLDDRFSPNFHYDEIFGTVLNRFMVQAVHGYPLTVFGSGQQVRGYLDLRDTLKCVRLSAQSPAEAGELRVFNQFTQTFSVNDLARLVADAGKRMGLDVTVQSLTNPRVEKEEHYYQPVRKGLLDLGLEPHLLDVDGVEKMMQTILPFAARINEQCIYRGITWK